MKKKKEWQLILKTKEKLKQAFNFLLNYKVFIMNLDYLIMLKLLTCIVVIFFTSSCVNSQTDGNENITCNQALELIKQHMQDTSFVIIDVRTETEYNSGHINKSINIDFNSSEFNEEIGRLNQNKTFLIYCKGGVRSAKAIKIMKKLGFKNIFHLFEGFDQWKNLGYEILE